MREIQRLGSGTADIRGSRRTQSLNLLKLRIHDRGMPPACEQDPMNIRRGRDIGWLKAMGAMFMENGS